MIICIYKVVKYIQLEKKFQKRSHLYETMKFLDVDGVIDV